MSVRIKCKEHSRPQIFICNHDYFDSDTESETDLDTESEVSDSEDGSDYESESESESESDSESLDDPKPYYGKGFRVYFDSKEDKKFFMKAFGFST
jgi:hypothetical protein